MCNFGTLYFYELKKILQKKMVWITWGVIFCFVILMAVADVLFVSYEENGEKISAYEKMVEDRENARALSGRKIDDTLLDEMKQANQGKAVIDVENRELDDGMITISTTVTSYDESFDQEESKKYSAIYNFVQHIKGNDEAVMNTDSEGLYQTRANDIATLWNDQKLSEGEIAYWQEKEAKLEIPFTYEYADGCVYCLDFLYSMNFWLLMLSVICLSGVFADEHLRKTDQVILGSRNGKKVLYFAKIAAGGTFVLVSTTIFLITGIVLLLAIYGADGLEGAIQLAIVQSSWKLNMGETILCCSALLLLMAGLYSVITMFLSESLRSSVAAMALVTGVFFILFFLNIPYQHRGLSQMLGLTPAKIMRANSWADLRLVNLFGKYLMAYQFAPILYVLIAVLLIVLGKRMYEHFQIGGR